MSADPPQFSLEQHQANLVAVLVHERMGLTLIECSPERTVMVMPDSEEIRGHSPGTIHGGMLATFADAACAMAMVHTYDWTEEISVTTDMHVRYFAQPKSWPAAAVAHVVHRGRRFVSVECSITDAGDRQLVRATATYVMVPYTRS